MSGMSAADGIGRERKRESFNTVAALYDRYRRGYPREIVAQVVEAAGIGPGSRVLEIGPGSGQLTRPLLALGIRVTAVELGEALAAAGRQKLARFPHLEIVISAFEDWELPREPFDAVVAATSFHWIAPEVRAPKAAQALKPGGILLAVYPHHVQGNDAAFFRDTQVYYLKWGLSSDSEWHPPDADEVPAMYPDIDRCHDFAQVERRRIRRTIGYTTDQYVGLLSTDSLILTLPAPAQDGFLTDIRTLIDSRYEGRVSRDYLYELVAARKRAAPI